MDHEQTLEARLALMSDEEKQHFKMVVLALIACYGPDATNKAVMLIKINDELSGLTTLNCDEMEAAEMLVEVNSFFGFLNTMDAPPKEAFN